MIVLADYNLNRQAILISGSLVVSGLLDLALIRLRTFEDVGLPADSNDRSVMMQSLSAAGDWER
jgi:hypothetical protein